MTRILVVEDEESYSDPLSDLLRKEGDDVAVAEPGPAALRADVAQGHDPRPPHAAGTVQRHMGWY